MIRAALALALAFLAAAQPAAAYDYRVLHLIEDRHTHVVIRTSEPPEGGDPPERGRSSCSAVDPLGRQERNVADALGRMFQRSSIHVDTILTSRVCRMIESARLLEIGPVTEEPLLDPFEEGEDREARTEALLSLIDGFGASETALLITQADNIEALTGQSLDVGEGLVFRLPPFGEFEVRGRFDLPPH